jgi:hypothetical protein
MISLAVSSAVMLAASILAVASIDFNLLYEADVRSIAHATEAGAEDADLLSTQASSGQARIFSKRNIRLAL